MDEAPGTFDLQSLTYPDLKKQLKRLEFSKGERVLGVRMALDGSDSDELTFRLLQVKALGAQIRMSPFSRLDAETIYRE